MCKLIGTEEAEGEEDFFFFFSSKVGLDLVLNARSLVLLPEDDSRFEPTPNHH